MDDAAPPVSKPDGIPIDYTDHARLMFDLLAVAFQSDLTRIATFMLAREGSTRAYREIGLSDSHHPLTHHRGNPEMIAKVTHQGCAAMRFRRILAQHLFEVLRAVFEREDLVLFRRHKWRRLRRNDQLNTRGRASQIVFVRRRAT